MTLPALQPRPDFSAASLQLDAAAEVERIAGVLRTQVLRDLRRRGAVVAGDGDVAIRRVRQILLQRLPMIAVVERDVHAAFGAGEEQSLSSWIVADDAREASTRLIGREARDDLRPGLSEIARAEDVWRVIAVAMVVDRDVRRAGVEV